MAYHRQNAEWSAQQALSYITGLEAADEESQYEAFATAYNYFMNLSRKKISWSVYLEKLAYQFIDLAFTNNKHSSIKDVLRSYRSLTQSQYPESLKDVLEYYRDRKLEVILEEDILHENVDIIVNLPNVENEEASSTVIFSSFRPDQKKKVEQIKNKLKIVWQGYKYIIETVKINQKLEDVYKATLTKVFSFVNKYNRKHEFKSFCRTLRSGLMTAFSKRDRSEQQKGFYIDIEKTDVNDRNIDIRLDQFKVTIKLGLWQEAFQVLEDINNLMKVRKGTVKSKIKFKYFQNLAILFKKSNYWHYHAFAYYNYYLAAQKNPNLSAQERKQFSDKLLLSVICIPPVTHESNQRLQSQKKISNMMIASNKIPTKNQLFEIIVSAGIVENASLEIKNLWNFNFLDFNLDSLKKGLDLLKQIKVQAYDEFKLLIEDILIYKQLLSISEIYQKIKIESLLTMIPLPRQKIEKILLDSYHQKILDFVLDENQKIIIFEDKSSQKSCNPTENFLDIYIDLALEKEKQRKMDGKHIIRKAEKFLEDCEEYYDKIRPFKIEQMKKKLKKPKQELINEAYRKKKLEQEQAERIEIQKKMREQQAMRLAEEKKKEFGHKKIIINDIIEIKQQRVVRVIGKKVEELNDEEIENITIDTLSKSLEEIKTKIQNNKQNKFKKAFCHVDYLERERRVRLDKVIRATVPSQQQEKKQLEQINKISKIDFDQKMVQKEKIHKMMPYLEPKIKEEEKKMSDQYEAELQEYNQRITDYFKEKIITRAKNIAAENKRKKEQLQTRLRNAQTDYDSANNTKWTFKQKSTEPTAQQPQKKGFNMGIKIGAKRTDPSAVSATQEKKFQSNPYDYINKDQKPAVWGRKKQEDGGQKKAAQEKKETGKWGFKKDTSKDDKPAAFGAFGGSKKQQPKPEDKNRPKKNYVNVN